MQNSQHECLPPQNIKLKDQGTAKQGLDDFFGDGGDALSLQEQIRDNAQEIAPNPDLSELKLDKTEIPIFGGNISITSTAKRLAEVYSNKQELFYRRGRIVTINREGTFEDLTPEAAQSFFEPYVQFVTYEKDDKGHLISMPLVLSRPQAAALIKALLRQEKMPLVQIVTNCPVLRERNNELRVISGYDRETGILARGAQPEEMFLSQAKAIIHEMFDDFKFVSEGDRSRAFAFLLIPALQWSGLVPTRNRPFLYWEADEKGGGKGYGGYMVTATYNFSPVTVSKKKSGVGKGIDESIDTQLIGGKPFTILDNLRGKIDSEALEAFLTSEKYAARKLHQAMTVDTSYHVVMGTSNSAQLTSDLADRSLICRIIKQPESYVFKELAKDVDILTHIQKNQPRYLGAVFRIIREWHGRGRPRTNEYRHRFREWVQPLDWMCQHLLDAAPLMGGHQETQSRASTSHLSWLRKVAQAVEKSCLLDRDLQCYQLADICDNCEITLPGLEEGRGFSDASEKERKQVFSQIGRKLSSCFKHVNAGALVIDGFTVERREVAAMEGSYRTYRFSKLGPEQDPSGRSFGSNPVDNRQIIQPHSVDPVDNIQIPEKTMSITETRPDFSKEITQDLSTGSTGSTGSLNQPQDETSSCPLRAAVHDNKWSELSRLVLGFVTFRDNQYNLKKLNYQQYVSDARFKVYGLAIKYPDGCCEFRTDVMAVLTEFAARYGRNLEQVVVVCYNAHFDLFVLKHHFGIVPDNIIDTLSMARLLHSPDGLVGLKDLAERYGLQCKGDLDFVKGVANPDSKQPAELTEYALNDLETIARLAEPLLPLVQLPLELGTIEHTIKLFLEKSLYINKEVVEAALEELQKRLQNTLSEAGYSREDISGDKSFRKLLGSALAKTGRRFPMKLGKKGPVPALSKDDPQMQTMLIDEDPKVRKLVELRLLVRSVPATEKRLRYLLDAAESMDCRLPVFLNYSGAGTGRFSGGNGFNIQNLSHGGSLFSIINEAAASVKQALIAAPGHKLVGADASQIEPRILSLLAGEYELNRAFAEGLDVYSGFASEIFKQKVEKLPPEHPEFKKMKQLRNIGKAAILGLGYGMGWKRFFHELRSTSEGMELFNSGVLTDSLCQSIVQAYRNKYPKIIQLWQSCEAAFTHVVLHPGQISERAQCTFSSQGNTVYIKLPSGRSLVYPNVVIYGPHITYGNNKRLYGGMIVENIIQAIARDILVEVIYRLEQRGYPVLFHIHDEIICSVPDAREDECLNAMIEEWRRIPAWLPGLVLDAEGIIGNNLMELK